MVIDEIKVKVSVDTSEVNAAIEEVRRAIARLSDALADLATKVHVVENDGVLREVERG